MRRLTIFFILILLLLAGCLGSLYWLMTTPEGARWVLSSISRWTPVTIEAQKISGQLGHHLTLEGLRLSWAQGQMNVKDFQIRWHPLFLLTGKVMIEELRLQEVHLRDQRPEMKTIPDLKWPTAPHFAYWIHSEIKKFHIENLAYQRSDRPPQDIERLTVRLNWADGLLTLEEIDFRNASVTVKGSIELGLAKPGLHLQLNVKPSRSLMGFDNIMVNSRLLPVRGAKQMKGNAFFEAMAEATKKFSLETEIGLTRDTLQLPNFRLSRPGRQGTFTGQGSILFSAEDPILRVKTNFTNLDLSLETGLKSLLSGTIDVQGSLNDYQGTLRIENEKSNWYSGFLSGTFKGNSHEIHLTLLDGSFLDGNLKGHLKAGWRKDLSLEGDLEAAHLNPARITPEWEGKLHLHLKGKVFWPKEKSPEAKLKVHLLQSHLLGQPITGEIDLHLEKSLLHIIKADLKGRGVDLFARGTFGERIAFQAEIDDLSGVIPGTQGSLRSKGMLRWKDHQRLALDVTGKGKDLFFREIFLGSGEWEARFGENEDGPIELKVKLQNVIYQSIRFDAIRVEASGKLSQHRLILSVQHPETRIKAILTGGYDGKSWQGSLLEWTGTDSMGLWKLQTDAEINISSHRLTLKSFKLASSREETLSLHGDLILNPFQGTLEMKWHQLNLARANPFLKGIHLEGQTRGDLIFQWWAQDRMKMAGEALLEGAIKNTSLGVDRAAGRVKFQWDEKQLQASTVIEFSTGGRLQAKIFSAQPARMEFPKQVQMDGQWESIDLLLFKPWLPKNVVLDGKLSGRLSGLFGRGSRFDHSGSLRVVQGRLKWKDQKDQISTELQTVDLNWIWEKETLKGDLYLMLSDYARLKTTFQIPVIPQRPWTIDSQGLLRCSLKGWVHEKGLLSSFFPEWIRKSQGNIELDLNAHGTWEKPRLGGQIKLKKAQLEFPLDRVSFLPSKNHGSTDSLKVEIQQGMIKGNWSERGLFTSCDLDFGKGVQFQANITSPQPAQMAFPDRGTLSANWAGIDLGLFKLYLPRQVLLEGTLAGHLSGQWRKDQFETTGEFRISHGAITFHHEEGTIKAPLQRTEAKWSWRKEYLSGEIALALQEHGYLKGGFQLPLPSRFPISIEPEGPIKLSLEGMFEEKGLLPALLPGMVQESQGQLRVNLIGNGTWKEPNLKGRLTLEKARGYLPSAGIRLEDIRVEAQWVKDQIHLASIQIRSGPGSLEGRASLTLKNWKVIHYEGHLKGDRFQTIRLPELQVLSNPRLHFQGTPRKILITGEIGIPEFLLSGQPSQDRIRPSSDVMIMDAPQVTQRKYPFALDMQIRLVLGEKVLVNMEGLEARLIGQLTLKAQEIEKIHAEGEIRAVQGHYTAFGQKLELIRGRLFFTGGSLDNPSLDGIAVRKVGEVQAGVAVTGTLKKPLVRLYSRPSMPDTDVLSYIVLGQPLGKGVEATPSLIQAAGAFLTAGESVLLQGQLKKLFGLDTLDITIPPGEGEVARSMVTIGKYLTPKLYISLGRSLFTDTTLVTLRYTLSKRLEVEAATGTETGATLFYRIEFR